ncbi:MAG: iron transporter [Candidatus Dactylopiibacterium carminicum]|uniref:Iron transporter n=1 Tax=Candidatus Dactylopiibacterium carminicum TaxID=857335 RepID=A0A272EWU7_9RHOO|nr:iron transporter [Candidatus Dactylopiibacterium carminicum]KAF7600031.1 iron transporter [Candidatus Dactylopiibacterium carminicum]PAS94579.1 MAG: iron transporter [Candidatus Dactylopiibacterium carminicum]PAS97619.1 MAG: iron transporter [Candidatus Dactylopiibacterium carminicum]PAT00035.1 MAG: iron transporter [Candidatus Dactylopiibacterium carminicum]
MKSRLLFAAVCAGAFTLSAQAFEEFPIGEPVTLNEMEIAAVYLAPIDMEPRGMGLSAAQSDIHLEADIHAVEGNKNGFGAGEWMPNLVIEYTLANTDTGAKQTGTFMPMVAADGPHYGQNIKMPGVGNYKLTYHIQPPSAGGLHRHTDSETGVARWWRPFDVSFSFKYAGLKKKK